MESTIMDLQAQVIELSDRVLELEKKEERRQRNLQEMIEKYHDSEQRHKETESIYH